jgi:excinuclease UvrABC nuclease subunit
MVELALPTDRSAVASFLESIPNVPAVFLLWPRSGEPHLGRTNVLRRRLSRLSSLFGTAERLQYQTAGSKLESRFLHLELARQYLGADYRREIKLRLPFYVRLVLSNPFPRTRIVARLGRGEAVHVGPFRTKSTAVQFEAAFLDLFQLRRCAEDLAPSPEHPGCIYGEMGRCMRPCQQMVGIEEYHSEAMRVAEFLRSGGRSLMTPAMGERERLSSDMDFEGAARAHQRVMKIEEVMGWRDEMARDVERLHAIAVAPSSRPDCVELGWLRGGYWHGFRSLDFTVGEDGRPLPLDARLREMAALIPEERRCGAIERMEDLAVLSRWFYSSWCDGELLVVDEWEKISFRKLVNSISRVARVGRKAGGRAEAPPHEKPGD